MSLKPRKRVLSLSPREISLLLENAKVNEGLTILRPVRPQPPAKYRTGDVAPLVQGRRWAYGRYDLGHRSAWPPDPLPGFLCPYGHNGERRRFGVYKGQTLLVGRVQLVRLHSLTNSEMLSTGFEPDVDGIEDFVAKFQETKRQFGASWDRGWPRRQQHEKWSHNPWVWVLEIETRYALVSH